MWALLSMLYDFLSPSLILWTIKLMFLQPGFILVYYFRVRLRAWAYHGVGHSGRLRAFFRDKRPSLFFSAVSDVEMIKRFYDIDYRSQKSTTESNQNVEIFLNIFPPIFTFFGRCKKASGLYYKHITIIIGGSSWVTPVPQFYLAA
jgi:hypothetical protein